MASTASRSLWPPPSSKILSPLSVPDEDHSATEERWLTLGQAANGTLLVVIHTYLEVRVDAAAVRIISARRAGRRERRQYESK